jgi:hypothetical protein
MFEPFSENILCLWDNLQKGLKFQVQAFFGCVLNMVAQHSEIDPLIYT